MGAAIRPAAALALEEDSPEAEQQRQRRDPEPDRAAEGLAGPDWATVLRAHPDRHEGHPRGPTGSRAEDHQVDECDHDPGERSDRQYGGARVLVSLGERRDHGRDGSRDYEQGAVDDAGVEGERKQTAEGAGVDRSALPLGPAEDAAGDPLHNGVDLPGGAPD